MKTVKSLWLTVLAGCVLSIPTIGYGFGINCVLDDLDESLGDGGDLWQATYTIDGSSPYYMLEYGEILAVSFHSGYYRSFEWVDNTINAMWSDGEEPLDDIYASLKFTLNFHHISQMDDKDDFSIRFIWGGAGDPGGLFDQRWALYESNYEYLCVRPTGGAAVNITEINHLATPAPEPTTMVLWGVGLAGLAGFRRRVRNSE